jgi:hypothetical protein
MLRAFSLFGFGGLFLLISPNLRGTITSGLESLTHQMALYSPWSYVGGVILVLMVFMFSMYRGAQPR